MSEEIRIACEGAATIPLDEFVELQGPLKSLSVDNYTKLKNVIIEHGFSAPVSVWRHKDKFKIIDGHQRVRVLRGMLDEGYKIPKKIPVVWIEAKSEKEAVLKCLAAASAYGHVEDEGLYELMVKHKLTMGDVKNIELPKIELPKFAQNFFDEPVIGECPDDEVPEVKETSVKLGDLYQLGEHRLLCGDCTVKENVDRLMAGEKADMVFTDPPYGIDKAKTQKNKYTFYNDSKENLTVLITKLVSSFWTTIDRIIITPGNQNQRIYPQPSWTMAWFTPAGSGSGPWGFCCWQPILCYGKDPKLSLGLGRHPDAIVHTESSEALDHPCPKPIKFWQWLLERTSEQSEKILDPFLGSGSTLIACEKTGRKCFGMEIDPHYCQVIIDRWEKFTGKKAVKLEDAKPKVIVRKKAS